MATEKVSAFVAAVALLTAHASAQAYEDFLNSGPIKLECPGDPIDWDVPAGLQDFVIPKRMGHKTKDPVVQHTIAGFNDFLTVWVMDSDDQQFIFHPGGKLTWWDARPYFEGQNPLSEGKWKFDQGRLTFNARKEEIDLEYQCVEGITYQRAVRHNRPHTQSCYIAANCKGIRISDGKVLWETGDGRSTHFSFRLYEKAASWNEIRSIDLAIDHYD